MDAQEFVHEAVVNNPHIAHANHLMDDLAKIGFDGAWNRTGQSGVTVQSYMNAWNAAVNDITRDPVVTVVRGFYEQEDAEEYNPIIYVFLGLGGPRCVEIASINYVVAGQALPFTANYQVIDDNNIRADLNIPDNSENAESYNVVLKKADDSTVTIDFQMRNAATDLYTHSAVSSIDPHAEVTEPVRRNRTDSIYEYSGGVISCYLGRGATRETGVKSLIFSRSGDGSGGIEFDVTTSAPVDGTINIDMTQFTQLQLDTMYTYANAFVKYLPSNTLVKVTGEVIVNGSETDSHDASATVHSIIRNVDGTFTPLSSTGTWVIFSAYYTVHNPESPIDSYVYTSKKFLRVHMQNSDSYNENTGYDYSIGSNINGRTLTVYLLTPYSTETYKEVYPDLLPTLYTYTNYWLILESAEGLEQKIGPLKTSELFASATYTQPSVRVASLKKTGDSYVTGNTTNNGVWTISDGYETIDRGGGVTSTEYTTQSILRVSMSNTENYSADNPSYTLNVTPSSMHVTQIRLLTGSAAAATGEAYNNLLPTLYTYSNYWLVTSELSHGEVAIGPLKVSDLIK